MSVPVFGLALAATALGSLLLFRVLAAWLPGFAVLGCLSVLAFFIVDFASTKSMLGIRYTRSYSGWDVLGRAMLAIAFGPAALVGAVGGWAWGARTRQRCVSAKSEGECKG